MGIENREYMSEPERGSDLAGHPYAAVIVLIVINAAVWFAWQLSYGTPHSRAFMFEHFTCSFDGVFHRYYFHTLLTSAISHIDPFHILFNMLFFWYLGCDVEAHYGRTKFVALYIVAGIMAALGQCGLNFVTGKDIPMLGASGSVMGIAVVAAILQPSKPMLLFLFVRMQLWVVVVIYILLDLSGMMRGESGIAHAGHLGGAFAGYLFYRVGPSPYTRRRGRAGLFGRISRWWRGRKFRTIEGGVERPVRTQGQREALRESWTRPSAPPNVDAESARRVDEILTKISKQGMDALTTEERAFLQNASEKYKKR